MELVPSGEIDRREDFGLLCNKHKKPGTRLAVELGVYCAGFSVPFLTQWTGRMLYAVDPWTTNLDGYRDILNEQDRDRSCDMMLAMCCLAQFPGRVTPLRCKSRTAAGLIPDGVEFVYIDGNHSKEYQYDDMTAYWQKLKSGGILAGHDLDGYWKDDTMWALERFTKESGIHKVFSVPGEAASWYTFKP